MEALGGVGADGDFPGSNVLHELEDAAFDVFAVGGVLDIFAEFVFEFLQCFGRVSQEQETARRW